MSDDGAVEVGEAGRHHFFLDIRQHVADDKTRRDA